METKLCRKCSIEKPIDCFSRRGEGPVKKRINIDCKECISKEAKVIRELRKTAPPIPKVCDCCGKIPDSNSFRNKLQLDHNHLTGEFRGWICDNCNVSLSRAGDTLEGVKNLVRYLKG
tara:strand:- start:83 stop:436 length:354 start_codon:yes stop_codon:yes gene_type:complete